MMRETPSRDVKDGKRATKQELHEKVLIEILQNPDIFHKLS